MIERETNANSTVIDSPSTRFARIAKILGIGFFSAVITGIISGLLLRIIMKIIAIAFPDMASGFTFEGTLFLVFLSFGFSLANSIIYTFIHQYLPDGWVRKGLIYGGLNLCIFGIPFFLSNPNSELFGPQAPLGITLFSLLFLLGGLLLAMWFNLITNWVNRAQRRRIFAYVIFALLILPAIVIAGGIIYEFIYELIPAIRSNY
ncbi:hypothetical protein ABES02_08260 [Neobacillus pocheonensis]|uniref:hypothetical protein n=1 Tax=Neobacillus pocheonensis TaxID=363869 RepID=UPI003D2CA3AB